MSLLKRIEQGQGKPGEPRPSAGPDGASGEAHRISRHCRHGASAHPRHRQAGSFFDLKTRVQNKLLAELDPSLDITGRRMFAGRSWTSSSKSSPRRISFSRDPKSSACWTRSPRRSWARPPAAACLKTNLSRSDGQRAAQRLRGAEAAKSTACPLPSKATITSCASSTALSLRSDAASTNRSPTWMPACPMAPA